MLAHGRKLDPGAGKARQALVWARSSAVITSTANCGQPPASRLWGSVFAQASPLQRLHRRRARRRPFRIVAGPGRCRPTASRVPSSPDLRSGPCLWLYGGCPGRRKLHAGGPVCSVIGGRPALRGIVRVPGDKSISAPCPAVRGDRHRRDRDRGPVPRPKDPLSTAGLPAGDGRWAEPDRAGL